MDIPACWALARMRASTSADTFRLMASDYHRVPLQIHSGEHWIRSFGRLGQFPRPRGSRSLVDLDGFEPSTSSMPWKRAPNCATGPLVFVLTISYAGRAARIDRPLCRLPTMEQCFSGVRQFLSF